MITITNTSTGPIVSFQSCDSTPVPTSLAAGQSAQWLSPSYQVAVASEVPHVNPPMPPMPPPSVQPAIAVANIGTTTLVFQSSNTNIVLKAGNTVTLQAGTYNISTAAAASTAPTA